MELAAVHFGLALTLFLLVNWIGRRLYRHGYMPISIVYRHDRAPALNAGIRVLAPLIFLVLSSTALYALDLDAWVERFWDVALYCVLFRWLFVAAWGRITLLNWQKELAYAALIVGGSYWLYETVIRYRTSLLPDASELASEVWVITVLFLFYMMHELGGGDGGSEGRKSRYVVRRARQLRSSYEAELRIGIPGVNRRLESLVLAVMVFESFNRPYLFRVMENIGFRVGLSKTLGIMQVTTREAIDDSESARQGIGKMVSSWDQHRDDTGEWQLQRIILEDYNPSGLYESEVSELASIIFREMFPDSTDQLSNEPKKDHTDFFVEQLRIARAVLEEEAQDPPKSEGIEST